RRLPTRSAGGPLCRARRLRPRRLPGDGQGAGQSPGQLDLDRWRRAHSGRAPRHPPRTQAGRGHRGRAPRSPARVTGRWRWLVPLSAVPVLALLAYGFRLDPREVASPLVGRPAAPFTLATFEGPSFSLAEQRGKVLVVNFWASWCQPACYDEAPVL